MRIASIGIYLGTHETRLSCAAPPITSFREHALSKRRGATPRIDLLCAAPGLIALAFSLTAFGRSANWSDPLCGEG
jgi:hypothetical protein